MSHPDDSSSRSGTTPAVPPAAADAAESLPHAPGDGEPQHHPPFARSPDDYTDPPGHHRRGPHGPALDVGA